MNFKAGDIVWNIDPNNNDGHYDLTHYHRKCVVVSPGDPTDESEHILRDVWVVKKKFFAHVPQKAVIV